MVFANIEYLFFAAVACAIYCMVHNEAGKRLSRLFRFLMHSICACP